MTPRERLAATATRARDATAGAAMAVTSAAVIAAGKPRLRGVLHAVAVLPALAGTAVLVRMSAGDGAKQVSLLIYGLSAVVLFTVSATYHIGTWSPRRRAWLRRLDHASIFILIAGTYTPIATTLLSGGWRVGILAAVWGMAGLGLATVAPWTSIPRWLSVGLYLATGWVVVVAMPQIVSALGPLGMALVAAGGALYSLGAVAYATRRPRLWPRTFGYHEVFHACVVAADAAFFTVMLVKVVPARG